MTINHYINQFEKLYSGGNWVGMSITGLLNEISFEKAIKRRLEGKHNIFELLEHIIAWRTLLIKRLEGNEIFDIQQNDQLDWPAKEQNQSNWEQLLLDFKDSQKQLVALLGQKQDELLEEKVAQKDYNFRHLINGVIQHDYYHFGQIALLI